MLLLYSPESNFWKLQSANIDLLKGRINTLQPSSNTNEFHAPLNNPATLEQEAILSRLQ